MPAKVGLVAVFDTAAFTRGLNVYINGLNQVNNKTSMVSKAVGFMGNVFQNALGYIARDIIVSGVRSIAGFAGSTVEAASNFEDAWTGVMKTVDDAVMTTEDGTRVISDWGKTLRQDIRDLAKEIPIIPDELAQIAEIGGQLGVEGPNIIDFTKVIAMLGVTTNLTSEAAATSMARFMNVMGTAPENTRRVASSIVELGNNFATTESEILSFAQRIAASGKISNLTEGDVLGIATAFSSVGIQAQAGGTAVQKVLLAMDEAVGAGGEKLETFAAVAGLSGEEFAALWGDNAAQAFQDFVSGLGSGTKEANGFLQELELNDSRLKTAFLSLAQDSGILTDAINDGNRAFEEDVALTQEAELRFGTFSSQMQILKNVFNDLKISIGDALLPVLADLGAKAKEFVEKNQPQIEAFLQNFAAFAENAGVALMGLADILMGLMSGEMTLTDLIPPELLEIGQKVGEVFNQIGETLSAVWSVASPILTGLGEALVRVGAVIWEAVQPAIQSMTEGFQPFIDAVSTLWNEYLQPFVAFLGGVLVVAFGIVVAAISGIVAGLAEFIAGVGNTLTSVINFTNTLIEIFITTFQIIQAIFTGNNEALGELVTKGGELLVNLWTSFWDIVKNLFTTATVTVVRIIETFIKSIIAFFEGLFKTLVGASIIPDMVNAIIDWFKTLYTDAINWIKQMIDKIVTFFQELPVKVKEILEQVVTGVREFVGKLKDAGRAIVDGLIDGIKGAAGRAIEAAKGVVKGAIDAAKSLLGMHSPSKVFMEIGAGTMVGMQKGIQAAGMLPISAVQGVTARMITQPIATTNNVVNNRTTQVNVNANYIGQPSQSGIYFDVLAALGAVG